MRNDSWPDFEVIGHPVEENIVRGLSELSPGPIGLTLADCTVISKATGTRRRVTAMTVEGEVVMEASSGADGYVELWPSAFLRVEVRDRAGRAASDSPQVGIPLGLSTIEVPVNSDGWVDFVVPCSSSISVYLLPTGVSDEAPGASAVGEHCSPRRLIEATVWIDATSEDAGSVVLTRRAAADD
jgi:hypothetical protein